MNKTKHILSCDWGTTSFRLRLVDANDATILNEVVADKGIASVYDYWLAANKPEDERINFYKAVLQSFIQKFPGDVGKDLPVIISGMATSTIGMQELAYKKVPFNLRGDDLNTRTLEADENCNHTILLISGLKTNDDVMRGEETMLLGCDLNDEDALVIFPGTHSKHVVIKNNTVTGFKTYMTGEVFDLLANKSVLSKSVIKNNQHHQNIFEKGVEEGAKNNLLKSAFHTRTNQLFKKFSPEENYHYLSGLVIGAELKEVSADKKIYLVCNEHLSKNYLTALRILNRHSSIQYQNADDVLIKAHINIHHHHTNAS